MDRRDSGNAGERAAERHLLAQGYSVVERNYRCRGGEIDLVAIERGTVAFVEVRRRAATSLVHPVESIDGNKRRRIVTAAKHFALRRRLHDHPMRFDVVAVIDDVGVLTCQLMRNAFDLDDLPPPRRPW